MQTVEQPPAGAPPEDLQLLMSWAPDHDETVRLRIAVAGTLLWHLLLVGGLGIMPRQAGNSYKNPERRPPQIVHLIDPVTVLTQKAPNKDKISKEIALQSPMPSSPVPTPAPGARSRKFQPPIPEPNKPPSPSPSIVEPPKVEVSQNVPQIALPQAPQVQPSETKPKLSFENVTPPAPVTKGNSRFSTPGDPVQQAIHDLSRGGSKGISGSDSIDLGHGTGLNMPPAPGQPRMDYELKSDPLGVDFKPYIQQALAAVRRNWFAVYPESAKLGTRGQVKVEFAIGKDGKVNKVVLSSQSGTWALDRAAVAAVSASNPFPALPAEFHGDRIVLAFTFSYNLGR